MKNMKRFTSMLYFFATIIILVGCSSNENLVSIDISNESSEFDEISTARGDDTYQVLVYGFSDSVPSAKHKIEYEFADYEKYSNQNIKQNITISIHGKNHSGSYQNTQYRGYNYFPSNCYLDADGNNFAVDDIGRLTSYFWGEPSSNGAALTKDECLQIAKDFVGDIVDVNQYDIQITDNKERERYEIAFTKYVNGLKSTDSASVSVKYDGTLYSYSSFMLERVNSAVISNSIDTNKAATSVEARLNEIYGEAKNKYSRVVYNDPEVLLTVLKDGSTGLIYSVAVDCINTYDDVEEILSERINFVVVVE